jgi:hypothetical protein
MLLLAAMALSAATPEAGWKKRSWRSAGLLSRGAGRGASASCWGNPFAMLGVRSQNEADRSFRGVC